MSLAPESGAAGAAGEPDRPHGFATPTDGPVRPDAPDAAPPRPLPSEPAASEPFSSVDPQEESALAAVAAAAGTLGPAGTPEELEGADATKKKATRRDSLLEISVVILAALFLALIIKIHVAEAYQIKGQSMQPTFLDGERVMVQKAFYELHRGDIVIFASKDDPDKDLIKRVIGLPGDEIIVRASGEVLVNGKEIDEDYIRKVQPARGGFGPFRVPKGQYFVLGDNRPQSQDSRSFGSISMESIKGKVFFRWWPLGDFTVF